MTLPAITVIIPCYRAAATLRRAVNSALRDAPENLELLLVDDGSPDGTGALCDALAATGRRATRDWRRPPGTGCSFWTPMTSFCPGCGRHWAPRWTPGPA